MRSRRSMKLLIGSLVMAFACVCCSTTDLSIEGVASGQQELQIIKLPSDQQELRDTSIESPFLESFPTVTFELIGSTATTYNDFILKIRNALKGPDKRFKIPMMRNPGTITDSNRFLLVKLSNKEKKYSTTLAVRVSDGYVVGFCCGKYDQKAKKDTAWFFRPENKIFEDQNKLLFKDAKHEDLGFKGNYDSLPNRATELGWAPMDTSIASLSKTENGKDMTAVKKAAVVLIQMVGEAMRYQYISNQVADVLENYNSFTPDTLMLLYENNWATLSVAVANSNREGNFLVPVQLVDEETKEVLQTVKTVSQIKDVLSLLKFV